MIRSGSFVVGCVVALGACAPNSNTAKNEPRPPFDAGRLKEGRFVYQTALAGDEVGAATISITHLDARTFRFRNEVTGQFRQTWESLSSAAMQPLAATLGIGPNNDKGRTMRLT